MKRLASTIGLIAAAVHILLGGIIGFLSMREEAEPIWAFTIMAFAGSLPAILAAYASLIFNPVIMFIAFVISFVPGICYLILAPGIFKLIGIAHLFYLVSGLMMVFHRRKTRKFILESIP